MIATMDILMSITAASSGVFKRWLKPALLSVLSAFILSAAAHAETSPRPRSGQSVVYAGAGADLIWYALNVKDATLSTRGSVTLPASIQEAWVHPSGRYLYVGWSDGGASSVSAGANVIPVGTQHGLTAFRIDQTSGALQPLGEPASLRARPIYLTTDASGEHVLVAYNNPSGLTVHSLRPDGSIGEEVKQPAALDTGIYGHQVRMMPSNRGVILVTRGNAPTAARPEDPGALKVFDYSNGVLANRASVAQNNGFGFQSRHLDFHPSQPWAYLTLERQNKLLVYSVQDGKLAPQPLYMKETLAAPDNVRPGQATSAIHVHPSGKFVYLGNRAGATAEVDGKSAFIGGENSIAAYAIDEHSGEPRLIQTIDSRGFYPRTFALNGSGDILVVANQLPVPVRKGADVSIVPASLAVFHVHPNGKLEFAHKYDFDLPSGRSLFWTGIVSLTK